MSRITSMGWNQLVYLNGVAIKVADYNVGVTQSYQVPPLVTGLTDKINWAKGLVEAGGNLSAPLVPSLGVTLLTKAFERNISTGDLTTFNISSTVHPQLTGAKVQSATISASSGEFIQVRCEIFGTAADVAGVYIPYSGYGSVSEYSDNQYASIYANSSLPDAPGSGPTGTTWTDEQIPMFDQVKNVQNIMPDDTGQPISFEFSVANNLIRNYVLGSPAGLDAWSVSNGQRDLTGSVTWQSGESGIIGEDNQIGQVINAGVKIPSASTVNIGFITIDVADALVLWGAQPPALNPNDRVTCTANFQLISQSYQFIDIAVD